jgi:hypothetical protein
LNAPFYEQRRQMLENFQQEAASYNSDFQTPYHEEMTSLPLGPDPLLVTEVKITPLAGAELELNILEKLAEQTRSLHIKLDAQLNRGFVTLLNQALTTSQWLEAEIGVTVKINSNKSSSNNESIALSNDDEKPRYLN